MPSLSPQSIICRRFWKRHTLASRVAFCGQKRDLLVHRDYRSYHASKPPIQSTSDAVSRSLENATGDIFTENYTVSDIMTFGHQDMHQD